MVSFSSLTLAPLSMVLLLLLPLILVSPTGHVVLAGDKSLGETHLVDDPGLALNASWREASLSERHERRLENGTDAQEGKTELRLQDEDGEGELPSCNDVLLHETTQERCHHAQNCEGEYMMKTLLPLAFCKDQIIQAPVRIHPILMKLFPMVFPLSLLVLTLLLFRLLGSTAENYFSPALEMLSSEFQIPPPLAGVTLLALGNGAPDVSAVVNAINMNASEGIQLSLGELTGGGMFVQSIVVGRIVFLGSSLATAKTNIDGEKVEGVTCREELIRDIAMYAISAGYVLWLCTKGVIFYRHVVAMLLLYCGYVAVVIAFEVRRYYGNNSVAPTIEENTPQLGEINEENVSLIHPLPPSFDEEDQAVELSPQREITLVDSSAPKRPDPPGIINSTRILRILKKQQERARERLMAKRKSLVTQPQPQDRPPPLLPESGTGYPSWSLQLCYESLRELRQHFYISLCEGIWLNDELSRFEWVCLSLESPFTIVRKLVTPIPCEEEYNRSLVAVSIALSPLWLLFYLSTKMEDFNPFCTNDCFPPAILPCCISFGLGALIVKYGPTEAASFPLRYSIPIALYGFLIAATWIDVISDQLVNVLEFIGVILRIPAPIMGMTVLAWGNSVGDYTTNGALAQRGLADMSMAACFAGPSFNLLVGLGSGLLTQTESLMSEAGLQISLMPSVQIGFVFLICNCIMTILSGLRNRGVIPKAHGYISWAIYFAYMTMNAQNLAM